MRKKLRYLKPPKEPVTMQNTLLRRPRRGKTDWAGIHFTDAFKRHLDLFDRVTAEKMFYDAAGKLQSIVAREIGQKSAANSKPLVKPQIAPCYTSYPATLSAYAALGLTAFLEFRSWFRSRRVLEYNDQSVDALKRKVDVELYSQLAEVVTPIVENRILLCALCSVPSMKVVEIYRLFAASQQDLRFTTVREIIQSVVLFGDVFPPPQDVAIHSLTRTLLREVSAVSRSFFDQLATPNNTNVLELGCKWVREICFALAKYLPTDFCDTKEEPPVAPQKTRWLDRSAKTEREDSTGTVPPLNAPEAPSWFDPIPLDQKAYDAKYGSRNPKPKFPSDIPPVAGGNVETIRKFLQTIRAACGQTDKFEDIRFDIMENAIAQIPFELGPVDGTPLDGHDVSVSFGDQKTATGRIFDRPIAQGSDHASYTALLEDSRPVTEALKRVLYPNVCRMLKKKSRRTTGALDPARLSLSGFSATVYKQYGKVEEPDRRGNPVVLIACDASGSLNQREMNMAKILTAAWLNSTARSEVRVMAGIYHSDRIHHVENAPLVQWIYHPKKISGMNRNAALKALAALPPYGTGVQSDALSIAFMMEEAKRLARGKAIYLIVVSDCQWNRSFNSQVEAETEMLLFFRKLYQQSENLHITLVALGPCTEQIEQLLDKVIIVNWDRNGPADTAGQIGAYVASVVKERRRKKRKQ